MTRGLPSIRPRTNSGKVFWFTRWLSTSTKPTVAFLSASGSAPRTGSIAPAPTSFSLAIAFCVAGLAGSFEDRISVTSRSARRFVKKLIQPLRQGSSRHTKGPLPESHACRQARFNRMPVRPPQGPK